MKSHLDPKLIIIAERFRFHRQNQKEGETMAQYLAKLRKVTEHCDFRNNLQEALRDRLVCGIVSVPIQKRLLAKLAESHGNSPRHGGSHKTVQ